MRPIYRAVSVHLKHRERGIQQIHVKSTVAPNKETRLVSWSSKSSYVGFFWTCSLSTRYVVSWSNKWRKRMHPDTSPLTAPLNVSFWSPSSSPRWAHADMIGNCIELICCHHWSVSQGFEERSHQQRDQFLLPKFYGTAELSCWKLQRNCLWLVLGLGFGLSTNSGDKILSFGPKSSVSLTKVEIKRNRKGRQLPNDAPRGK
jgi:hypothetical protein